MKTGKAYAAIIALVIGVYLLIEGAYPALESLLDGAFIALGAALLLSYFWLIGDYLERRFWAPREFTLMPVLLVLGLVMLGFGLVRPGLASVGLKFSFILPGLVLVIVAGWRLWKAIKR